MNRQRKKSRVVLLADSHQNMLEGIRRLLENKFDTVVMVADEKSLLETTKKMKPDLAIVDLSIPVSKEINVARELHNTYPSLKFIILSIHDDYAAVTAVLAAGAAAYVLKRSASADLIPAIDSVFAGRVYVSPAVEVGADA